MPRTKEGKKCHDELVRLAVEHLKECGYEDIYQSVKVSPIGRKIDVLGICEEGKKIGIDCQVKPTKPPIIPEGLNIFLLAVPRGFPHDTFHGVKVLKLSVDKPKSKWKQVFLRESTIERLQRFQHDKQNDDDVVNVLLDHYPA